MPGPISTPDDNGGRTSESSSPRDTSKSPTCSVRHGAEVNKKNDRGKATLQAMIYPPSWVERYGDPVPGIELLLASGAGINTLSDDGNTALDIAIEQENEAVAALLRERGGLRADELS